MKIKNSKLNKNIRASQLQMNQATNQRLYLSIQKVSFKFINLWFRFKKLCYLVDRNSNEYLSFQIRDILTDYIQIVRKYMKQKETPKITVVIRKRPLNKKEISRGETDIVKIQNGQSVIVSEYKQKVDLTKYIEETTFNFDHAYDQQSTNQLIYQDSIRPLIDSAFEGAKISCFAYGQTGSGKTFTMKGDMSKGVPGLYFLAAKEIFNYLQHPEFQKLNVFVSFYEIYCGKLFDLLTNRTELKIRQDKHANINIIGLEQKPIYSANQFLDIIEQGSLLRITSQNATNADSSRSHAIMQIHIKEGKRTFSKVSFIDLAGNQRGADHMDQNKQTKIDGAEINKSLLALKECIRALDQGKGHTPFRGSKLTMVLKDSFVGFCKTVMIGNVSPNVLSSQNTMNTLRYADRVKELKKPTQNLTRQEIQAKQLMLPRAANKNTVKVTIQRQDDAEDIRNKLENAKKKTVFQTQKMEIEVIREKQPVTLEKRGMTMKEPIISRRGESTNNFRVQQKKQSQNLKPQSILSKPQSRNNQNMSIESGIGSKKNLLTNTPLYQKNVIKIKLDQNNINSSNQDLKSKQIIGKQSLILQNNHSIEQLNRQHFDAMNNLHSQFSRFKDNHSKLVKEETIIIRDEMMKLGQMSQIDEWNHDSGQYLQLVEKSISEKIKLMEALQKEVQNLRKKKNQADEITRILNQQKPHQQTRQKPTAMEIQYPKGHQISSTNSMKYTYHSSMSQQPPGFEPSNAHNQYRMTQPYQYVNSYSNFNNNVSSLYQGQIGNNSENRGYHYNQYQMSNNYNNNYGHHDQQLLEDLPGDQNMQRLF